MGVPLVARSSVSEARELPELFELSDLVEVIGGGSFAAQMLAALSRICGADRCALFKLKRLEIEEIASVYLDGSDSVEGKWDLKLSAYDLKRGIAQVGLNAVRIDVNDLSDDETVAPGFHLLHRRQRVLIYGKRATVAFCLCLVRTRQPGSAPDVGIGRLHNVAELLVSMLAKHADLTERKPNLAPALASLTDIQTCIFAATSLSRREAEVCARILYGLSSCGIAIDLGIGKESVMTYRKRAYQRLGIGSQRELLMWYLDCWSSFGGSNLAALQGVSLN